MNFVKTIQLLLLLLLGLFIIGNQPLLAQVTIGASESPAAGAILQLKNISNMSDGSQNATKGLGLPRVELDVLDKLKIGSMEIQDTDDMFNKHTGLLVYNVTDNDLLCPGLYVWDSKVWQRLSTSCASLVDLSLKTDVTQTLYFGSGQNGNLIVPQIMNVEWTPTSATMKWINEATPTYNSPVVFMDASGITPLPWTSPQTVVLKPNEMGVDEIDPTKLNGNPFRTKESILKISAIKYGETVEEEITLNQTNKAITIDGKLQVPMITDPALTLAEHTLQSNAKWTLSAMDPMDGTNAFSDLQLNRNPLQINIPIDWEQNNNKGKGEINNLSYNVTGGASKARFSKLVFSDAENPKRFNDITLSMYQCGTVTIQV